MGMSYKCSLLDDMDANRSQLGRIVDLAHIDFSIQQLICGRNRKNIKLIESATGTAIYFPPPFSTYFRYCPGNAQARNPGEIIVTGDKPRQVELAKMKLREMMSRVRLYVKDVPIPAEKIDTILLTRLDKVRKIVESNGTFIQFPHLGSRQNTIRIQATDNLHIDRSVKELMSLVSYEPYKPLRESIADKSLGRTVLQRFLGGPAGWPKTARRRRDQDYARRHLR